MISIITSTENNLPLNMIFWENLKRFTHGPFELIVIDNQSIDGSRNYFLDIGAKVVYNHHAKKYPDFLLPAIKRAKSDVIAFMSNSMMVSKDWNKILIKDMNMRQREAIAGFTNNQPCNCWKTKFIFQKWKCLRFLIVKLLGECYSNFKLSAKLMYGDWEKWTQNNNGQFGKEASTLISSHLICKRSYLRNLGTWIKAGTFQFDESNPIHLSKEVYFHDFGKSEFIRNSKSSVEKQIISLNLDLEKMRQNVMPIPTKKLILN